MTDLNEQLRAEFEAHITADPITASWGNPPAIERMANGDYFYEHVRIGWSAWQAARRTPAAAPAPVAASDELDTMLTVFDMGLGFALCHRDFASTRNAVKKLQADFTAIRAALAAAPAQAAAPIVQPVADVRAKPSFFVIVDAQGRAEYVTMLGHEAQEHINDACGEGVEGAGKWKAVPVFLWRPTDDHLWNETIRDRDTYHDWADKLAYAIGKRFDVGVGEHSNQNLPWAEALNVIEDEDPTPASSTADAKDAAEVHGHREPYYLMANCRRLLTHPKWKSSPNWVIAMELFGCGSTSGWAICREAGIDGDSTTVERAAITSSAGEVKP